MWALTVVFMSSAAIASTDVEAATTASVPATATSSYAERFAQAVELVTAGHPGDAVPLLEALTGDHPQDYAAWLLLGRAAFEAKQWALAQRAFGVAVVLSARAPDAVAGLAWSHAHLGHREDARALFAELAPMRPDVARDGERFLEQTAFWAVQGFVALGGLWYPQHVAIDGGAGLSAGVSGHAGAATAALTVRGVGLVLDSSADAYAAARGNGRQSLLDQPGLYFAELDTFAAIGIDEAKWGITGHYHLGADTVPGSTSLRHSAGVSGWLSAVGVWRGEVSGSTFDEVLALRLAGRWRYSLGLGWFVEPGLAGQVVGTALRGSIGAAAGWASPAGGVFVSVKGGPEERPVFLDSALAYPLDDLIVGGAVLGGHIVLTRHHRLYAVVEVVGLSPPATVSSVSIISSSTTTAWFLQLGWVFGQLHA